MDRNKQACQVLAVIDVSLSARRAWIEIGSGRSIRARPAGVALRKESVDRNCVPVAPWHRDAAVALRKESVDRNFHRTVNIQRPTTVALRKESVDRNFAWHSMSEDVS